MMTWDIIVPPGKKRERLDVFLVNHVENATRVGPASNQVAHKDEPVGFTRKREAIEERPELY